MDMTMFIILVLALVIMIVVAMAIIPKHEAGETRQEGNVEVIINPKPAKVNPKVGVTVKYEDKPYKGAVVVENSTLSTGATNSAGYVELLMGSGTKSSISVFIEGKSYDFSYETGMTSEYKMSQDEIVPYLKEHYSGKTLTEPISVGGQTVLAGARITPSGAIITGPHPIWMGKTEELDLGTETPSFEERVKLQKAGYTIYKPGEEGGHWVARRKKVV